MATQRGDKQLRILLTGGGTGGHITPLLAVADELKHLSSDCYVMSIGDKGSAFGHLTDSHTAIDESRSIFAGKFRRYHGESWFKRLFDIRTNLLNLRDFFYVIIGCLQSLVLVKRLKPDVVFLKGGFVGVPVGLAAAFWHIPIITHDSDALPGLANRIAGRWAAYHATALPREFYNYNPDKVRHVGVLVGQQYKFVSEAEQGSLRTEIGLPEQGSLLFVTGGSLGSQRINQAVSSVAGQLLDAYADLTIIHQVGKGNRGVYGSFSHERLKVMEFVDGMYRYSGAADVIVTRAGANTLAEFGIQSKACVVIPSSFLAGGHQLKNGEYLAAAEAAVVLDENQLPDKPAMLADAVGDLLNNPEKAQVLARNLHNLTVPDASRRLAELLVETAG